MRVSSARAFWISLGKIVAVAVFLAGGAAAIFWHRPNTTPPPVQAASLAPSKPAPDAVIPANSDALVREALAPLSPRARFARWLKADHLLDRLAVITVSLAEDRSFTGQVEFLQPTRKFSVTRDGSHLVISPRTFARYDAFTNVIATLDDHHVAAAYRTLHPLLEAAYHQLGYPEKPLDAVVTRALQRIVDAPVREGAEVQASRGVYVFADTHLESLGAIEKQFLRIGPSNTRRIQAQARDLAAALGLPLTAAQVAAH